MLSHLMPDPAYLTFYREQRLKGSYLVLDNGAHENTAGEAMKDLLLKGWWVRADEIVLPDTLFDHRATVRGAEEALIYLLGPGQEMWPDHQYPQLMLVPQGRTRDEWDRCFQDLIAAYVQTQQARPDLFKRSVTIGVSKDYDMWPGGHPALLEHLEGFLEWMKFDVHLLGWASNLTVLEHMSRRFDWIRSTDSAKPFVYAINDIRLRRGESPEYPHRDPDYFEHLMTWQAERLARHNVRVFQEAAGDI